MPHQRQTAVADLAELSRSWEDHAGEPYSDIS